MAEPARRPGGLFCGVTKGGKLTYRDVSPQLIYRVVQKRHLEAGIAEFTPHDLRRSHISDLLDEGVDLAVITRQVRYSNVPTTARTTGETARRRPVRNQPVTEITPTNRRRSVRYSRH